MSQLFEMVQNNNYIGLNQLIDTNPTIDLTYVKSRVTLLYKSVEYRAKECFDVLVRIPSVIKRDNINFNSALYCAVKYYINGANPSNRYYIEKLIENGSNTASSVEISVPDKELFSYLFDKSDKTRLQYIPLLHNVLITKKMYAFECILNTLVTLNLNFHNGINILYETLIEIINCDNMEALGIFMKQNVNIKQYSFLLYTAYTYDSINTFNYFYDYYSKLTTEELNAISNVGNAHTLFDYYKNKLHHPYMFDKIFQLNINYIDLNKTITSAYLSNLNNSVCYKERYELFIKLLIKFFDKNMVQSNPIPTIDISLFKKILCRTFGGVFNAHHQTYNNYIAQFFDICAKYKFGPSPEISALLEKYKIPVKTN